jgi:hypothetical protein
MGRKWAVDLIKCSEMKKKVKNACMTLKTGDSNLKQWEAPLSAKKKHVESGGWVLAAKNRWERLKMSQGR